MLNDIRFAFRQLGKSPGFTLIAILTLALGIGMNTAIFSLIHDLFLRRLPFNQPERVVRIYGEAKERDLKESAVFSTKILVLSRRTNGFFRHRRGSGQRVYSDRDRRARAIVRSQCDGQLFRSARHSTNTRAYISAR